MIHEWGSVPSSEQTRHQGIEKKFLKAEGGWKKEIISKEC